MLRDGITLLMALNLDKKMFAFLLQDQNLCFSSAIKVLDGTGRKQAKT